MAEHEEIQQIIPAGGWAAVYTEAGGERSYPLICWALVEDSRNGERRVIGMLPDGNYVNAAADVSNFLKFEHEA